MTYDPKHATTGEAEAYAAGYMAGHYDALKPLPPPPQTRAGAPEPASGVSQHPAPPSTPPAAGKSGNVVVCEHAMGEWRDGAIECTTCGWRFGV